MTSPPLSSTPTVPRADRQSPSPAASSSPASSVSPSSSPASSPDRGYLKLIGESFQYILPSSTPFPPRITLGRKLQSHPASVFPIAVDRNISRQHAVIEWKGGVWELRCLGKNGMYLDDVFVHGDEVVRLRFGAGGWIKMQIGDVIFFVLEPIVAR
jgi:predicted component of type VI protein secretion system